MILRDDAECSVVQVCKTSSRWQCKGCARQPKFPVEFSVEDDRRGRETLYSPLLRAGLTRESEVPWL